MKNKLDLHGKKHTEVYNLIEDYILITKTPFSIITGNFIIIFFFKLNYVNCLLAYRSNNSWTGSCPYVVSKMHVFNTSIFEMI